MVSRLIIFPKIDFSRCTLFNKLVSNSIPEFLAFRIIKFITMVTNANLKIRTELFNLKRRNKICIIGKTRNFLVWIFFSYISSKIIHKPHT